MDRIRIRGGHPLSGEITIGGAKNAALPLMAAGLLTDAAAGAVQRAAPGRHPDHDRCCWQQHGIAVDPRRPMTAARCRSGGAITNTEAPYDIVRKMRASFLVLGPLLARVGEARVSLPGGCAIGARPIDLHLKGLEQLGARIVLEGGYIDARVDGRLQGRHHRVPVRLGRRDREPADGRIARRGPHRAGQRRARTGDRRPGGRAWWRWARASRASAADKLIIDGVERCTARNTPSSPTASRPAAMPAPRRSPAGRCSCAVPGWTTWARRCASCARPASRSSEMPDGLMVKRLNGLHGADVMTEPYPGFPTDMQAQFMALMSVADGASMVTETIFENRFMHVPELNRMGARINVHGASAIVRGVPALSGAPVMATDLRASLSLILAGLAAKGETVVNRVYHLDRGYEAVEQKLAACGADIERLAG